MPAIRRRFCKHTTIYGILQQWYAKNFIAGVIFGALLMMAYVHWKRRHLADPLRLLDYSYNIDKNWEETENDIASDIDYDKKISAIFPLAATASDIHLAKQKRFYQKQKERAYWLQNQDQLYWIQQFYIRQMNCPTTIRVGAIGESGYMMCNPWMLADLTEPCIVYSFGTHGVIQFEQGIYDLSAQKCQIFCYDQNPEPDLTIFEQFNGRFFQATISTKSDPEKRLYTIMDLTHRNGHSKKIDVLKMDIEGTEFSALPLFLRQYNGTICHLIIETHGNVNSDVKYWTRLFRAVERRGFRLYEKEHSTIDPRCVQYSYLHLNCFEHYHIKPEAVVFRYFS